MSRSPGSAKQTADVAFGVISRHSTMSGSLGGGRLWLLEGYCNPTLVAIATCYRLRETALGDFNGFFESLDNID